MFDLEVKRDRNLAGSRRDEPKSSLKMARRAETSFLQASKWRDEPRRALARARRAKNEPARPKISKKNETDEPALFDNV